MQRTSYVCTYREIKTTILNWLSSIENCFLVDWQWEAGTGNSWRESRIVTSNWPMTNNHWPGTSLPLTRRSLAHRMIGLHCLWLWAQRQYRPYRYWVTSVPELIPPRFTAVSRYSVYGDTGIGGPTNSLLIYSCHTVPDRINVRRSSVSAQSQACS